MAFIKFKSSLHFGGNSQRFSQQRYYSKVKLNARSQNWLTVSTSHYTAMTPSYIAEFHRPVAATHCRSRLRSATNGDLAIPRNCLELGKRAFATTDSSAWNTLPLSVRLAPSITTFKTALKTHLFSVAYGASKYQWLAYDAMITICFCKHLYDACIYGAL